MTHDATSTARAYIQVWNETDADRRAELLRRFWQKDARYIDPLMSGEGIEQIGALVGAVHERFPGFRFDLLGPADGHGEHVRFRWSLGPEGAPAPIEGSDVVRLDDGRIASVVGFLDKVPAAA
ncbi:MAG: nuclear transport factor 2 family protein [Caldimonas sp.]